MHPAFDITADLDTPVSAYLKLRPFGPRFLLESVEGGERLGRFSFIGFGDGLEVSINGTGARVGAETFPTPEDRAGLVGFLREALARAPMPGPRPPGVPFVGGLVGAFGFGMHRYFEGLPRSSADEPPLVQLFGPSSVLVFDHMTRRAALLHDGGPEAREALRTAIIGALRGPIPGRSTRGGHGTPRATFTSEAFQSAVRKAKDHIRAGDIYQIVLSIGFEGECDLEPFEVYRALRLLNPSPYMYFCEFGGTAVVGSSPEALVRLEGREAFLRPIAGTRPRGTDDTEDAALAEELLADPKENAEHVMLVDLARNDLGRVAVPGSVTVDPFRIIERYSHVMHMVSGVRGVLATGHDALDLFAAAFPAGTVVGAPKIRASEIIRDLEPEPRGLYAGSVGYFGTAGSMDQAITIRTLVFENGTYRYQAGAGLVADSVPEAEYHEVLAKSEALRAALRLAEEGL